MHQFAKLFSRMVRAIINLTIVCQNKCNPAQGESSEEDADQPSSVKTRAMCCQFVWPCPREFPADPAVRKARNFLIPEDMSKESLGQTFKAVLAKHNQFVNLDRLHIFDEPHKKFNAATGLRARHYHIIFRFKAVFAHLQIAKSLREKGIHGHFSFNLVGYQAYLQYCLQPSAHKLQADLDMEPWSIPSRLTAQELLKICNAKNPQQDGRNGHGKGKKRVLLTFSEITDCFVEANVKSTKDAWLLAKKRKLAGDDLLFNTLGASNDVNSLVAKVILAWNCEDMPTGTVMFHAKFPLHQFISLDAIHPELPQWVSEGHLSRALILQGEGGLGKTELACTIMAIICKDKGFHFVNKLDRLRDVTFLPQQGLIVDELCLHSRDIDDVKGLLDLAKHRDVQCRNKDGGIPVRCPRIFSTNWGWDGFFPPAVAQTKHEVPITRRVLWVEIAKDIRLPDAPVDNLPVATSDDEEDPFQHGGQLT